jgi:hypothetical protein
MLNSTDALTANDGSQAHLDFLSLASEDDGFRSELRRNPVAVLARFGLEIDPARLPATVRLPGKPAIRQALDSFDDVSLISPAWMGFVGC